MSIVHDKFHLHPTQTLTDELFTVESYFPCPDIRESMNEARYVHTHSLAFAYHYRELLQQTPMQVLYIETGNPGEDAWTLLDPYAEEFLRQIFRFRCKHKLRKNFERDGYSCYARAIFKVHRQELRAELASQVELVFKPLPMGERAIKDHVGIQIGMHLGKNDKLAV